MKDFRVEIQTADKESKVITVQAKPNDYRGAWAEGTKQGVVMNINFRQVQKNWTK